MDFEALGSSVQDVNLLTVVASESYRDFVGALQTDIKTVLYDRPTTATSEYFNGKYVKVNDVPTLIDKTAADTIEFYLISNGYVNMQRKVTDKYRMDVQMGTIAPLPAELEPMSGGIHTLIQSVYDDTVLDNMFIDGHESAIKGNPLNDNWAKKEFQALWNQINHKYAYTVSFDSNELIAKAIAHIDDKLFVSELQYTTSIGRQKTEMNRFEFDAVIEPVPDKGGAYIRVPIDIRKEFGKGRMKVHATFDGIPYGGSIVNMGVKNADGSICYILGLLKSIRNKLHKQPGDTVHVAISPMP